jgi:hypothetical protein
LPLLAACAVQSQIAAIRGTEADLQHFVAATNDSVACRAVAARSPRYRVLDERMPLTDIGAASLRQMADQRYASRVEIAALDAWSHDLDACRIRLLRVAYSTLPSFGPIIERAGNEDDATFVQLTQYKITWGTAVMRMKNNRTKLRSDLIARVDQVIAELGKIQQEQLNRRTTIFSSIIRIIP